MTDERNAGWAARTMRHLGEPERTEAIEAGTNVIDGRARASNSA